MFVVCHAQKSPAAVDTVGSSMHNPVSESLTKRTPVTAWTSRSYVSPAAA